MRAWLLRILTNLNIDRGRKQQRTPDSQPLEEGDYFLYNRMEQSSGTPAEERIVEQLSQDSIVNALSAVPHDFRDVIVLVDIGDFTYADAAQILDIPVGTVMSRLHRGRRILKRELADTRRRRVMGECSCDHCEQLMQPYLDRVLTVDEQTEAESHLEGCSYCSARYTFESELRVVREDRLLRGDVARAEGEARRAQGC